MNDGTAWTGGEGLLSLIWMLVCVVLVIGLAYWFTKYIVGRGKLGGFASAARSDAIKVLAYRSLGRGQQLVFVQAGSRYMLLGVTENTISKLAEFTPDEAEGWIGPAEQPADERPPSFGEALKNAVRKRKEG